MIMRTLFLILFSFLIFSSCQHQCRYAESGPEIDNVKAAIEAYEAGDWATQKSYYADTVKFYHNSPEGVSFDEANAALMRLLSEVAEYSFEDDMDFEFVTTDSGDHWVSWWGIWNGKLKANGQEFRTPVHISAKIEGGKIAEEYGYWDNQPLAAALMELSAAAAAEQESEE